MYGKVLCGDADEGGVDQQGRERVMSYPGACFRVVTTPEVIRHELIACMNEVDCQVETTKDSIRFIGYCGMQLQMCQYNPL